MFAWYAVRVRSRHDFAVRDALLARGLEAWTPIWRQHVRWSDRETVTARPLFPGYVFARFSRCATELVLSAHPGIVQILSLDQKPVPIADEVIAALQLAAARPDVTTCPYVAGVTIVVKSGPWAGCAGVVVRVKGATTLYIPVEVFGRSVPVPIDVADVE